jgi:hypothetical protein
MNDVIASGTEREPIGTRWLVSGAVLLVAFAAAGTLRATDRLHLPRAATAKPTVSVPPLETVAPEPPPLGSLVPDPRAIVAPPYGPGEGVVALLRTDQGLVRIATVDDMVRTLEGPGTDESFASVVMTRRGPVALALGPDGDPTLPSLLYLPGRAKPITDTGPVLLPGVRDDEFWTVKGDLMQRRDLDGRPVGAAVRFPSDWWPFGVTQAGLLLSDDYGGVRIWDPVRRRTVHLVTTNGVVQAIGSRAVAWSEYCEGGPCPLHLLDVTTGVDRLVPLPSEPGELQELAIDPTGRGGQDATSHSVWVVGPNDRQPRQVTRDSTFNSPLSIAWASPDVVVVVQTVDDQTLVYGWDRRTADLRLGGAYVVGTFDALAHASLT